MISPKRLEELLTIHLTSSIPIKKTKTPAPEPAWTIGISQLDGRGVLATRDIQPGEIIFRENPLLIGPTGRKDTVWNTCTACYKCMEEKTCLCKKGCSLPICDMCGRKKQHQQECELYRKYEPVEPQKIDPASLRAITVLRGLFLNKNQKDLIYALQANTDPSYRNEIRNASKCFKNFPTDGKTVEYLHRIVAVLNTNAFEVLSNRGGHEIALRGLYPLAGSMNHECTPNTSHYYEENNEMVVKATRPILNGEEITTTYTKLLWSTKSRQLFLRVTKQFTCACNRCKDPTENGTFLGALYCRTQQCGGHVIPNEPLAQTVIWQCQKCGTKYDAKQMSKVQDFALGTINGKADNSNMKDMIQFINEIIPKIVPVSNHLAVEAKLNVIWKMHKCKEDFSFTDYEDKARYCREIIAILEKLNAGDCNMKRLIEDAEHK